MQKQQACKVEAFEEHDEAYNGGVAVQKHSFKEEEEKYGAAAVKKEDEKYGEVIYTEYGAHYGIGAAVKKQGYGYKQEGVRGDRGCYRVWRGPLRQWRRWKEARLQLQAGDVRGDPGCRVRQRPLRRRRRREEARLQLHAGGV